MPLLFYLPIKRKARDLMMPGQRFGCLDRRERKRPNEEVFRCDTPAHSCVALPGTARILMFFVLRGQGDSSGGDRKHGKRTGKADVC